MSSSAHPQARPYSSQERAFSARVALFEGRLRLKQYRTGGFIRSRSQLADSGVTFLIAELGQKVGRECRVASTVRDRWLTSTADNPTPGFVGVARVRFPNGEAVQGFPQHLDHEGSVAGPEKCQDMASIEFSGM